MLSFIIHTIVGCTPPQMKTQGTVPTHDSNSQDTNSDPTDTSTPTAPPISNCSDNMNVLVVPLNIWGEDLTIHSPFSNSVELMETPEKWSNGFFFSLSETEQEQIFDFSVTSEGYHSLQIQLSYTGGRRSDSFVIEKIGDGRLVSGLGMMEDCQTYFVFVGLNHLYFAASAPVPTQNNLDFMINGEIFWHSVASDLEQVEEEILWSTWWWESDFEIVRSIDWTMSEEERRSNSILAFLEAKALVPKHILINRFWGENWDWVEYINTDSEIRDYAEQTGDNFEVILQGNGVQVPVTGSYPDPAPQYSLTQRLMEQERMQGLQWDIRDDQNLTSNTIDAASWHQKAIILDDIAYISGFNTSQGDWDTSEHLVFDTRRTEIDEDSPNLELISIRQDVPPLEPRRDYGVRVEGPVVTDIRSVFRQRWNKGIEDGVLYSDNATSLQEKDNVFTENGQIMAQVNVTMPNGEQSIFESHKRAIEQAQEYIFIEDQYFRAPIVNELIYDRMLDVPELKLIVITQTVDEIDPALQYSYFSHNLFQSNFPDRYLLLTLHTTDLVVQNNVLWDDALFYEEPIFIHSKLRMIDDIYLSVGSCNMNNRGYKFEGEMNLSIVDSNFVREQRRIVFEQLVGSDYVPYLSDDAENNFTVLRLAAEQNRIIADWWDTEGYWLSASEAEEEWAIWKPSGFLFPLDFSSDYIDIAGPDLF
jgi:hypothetical protein